MNKALVTAFVFLGNESAHSESMLHNIPFGSKVGCVYLHFYKIQTKNLFVEKEHESLLSWLCFETFQQIWTK